MKKILFILGILTISATILLFANKPSTITKGILKPMDSLVVIKTKGILFAYGNKKLIAQYKCSVGENLNGHKQKEGDNRTPEGIYHITMRSDKSIYYKNLHIDYPNEKDRARCKKLGVKPGGDIKLHGYADNFGNKAYRNIKFSYTRGCIGVTNADMDELYTWVKTGAVINIKP